MTPKESQGSTWERFLVELKRIFNVEELKPDFNIIENVDSLARAEMIVTAEEMFHIELTNEDILNCKTFIDLEQMVVWKVQKAEA
jgi:acyl carrier protein